MLPSLAKLSLSVDGRLDADDTPPDVLRKIEEFLPSSRDCFRIAPTYFFLPRYTPDGRMVRIVLKVTFNEDPTGRMLDEIKRMIDSHENAVREFVSNEVTWRFVFKRAASATSKGLLLLELSAFGAVEYPRVFQGMLPRISWEVTSSTWKKLVEDVIKKFCNDNRAPDAKLAFMQEQTKHQHPTALDMSDPRGLIMDLLFCPLGAPGSLGRLAKTLS